MGYRSPADHERESSGRYTPEDGDTPNDATVCEVTWAELPLNCPLPRMRLWDSHPRVYLPIHKSGREQCPYCGTTYVLAPPTPGEREPFFRGDIEMEKLYYQALEAVEKASAADRVAPAPSEPAAEPETAALSE